MKYKYIIICILKIHCFYNLCFAQQNNNSKLYVNKELKFKDYYKSITNEFNIKKHKGIINTLGYQEILINKNLINIKYISVMDSIFYDIDMLNIPPIDYRFFYLQIDSTKIDLNKLFHEINDNVTTNRYFPVFEKGNSKKIGSILTINLCIKWIKYLQSTNSCVSHIIQLKFDLNKQKIISSKIIRCNN